VTWNQPEVVFQSKHVLALTKPFGMPSQRDPSGDESLLDWATKMLGREPHLLHRLDRPTGGLQLFGKTKHGTRTVSRQFEQKLVQKTYLAVTSGEEEPPSRLEHFIGKLPGKNFVRAYDNPVRRAKKALTEVEVAERKGDLWLLRLRPATGRRHQLRAQLRTCKHSILGDQKYGKTSPLEYPGIALWAATLIFEDPKEGTVELEAPIPEVDPWRNFMKGQIQD